MKITIRHPQLATAVEQKNTSWNAGQSLLGTQQRIMFTYCAPWTIADHVMKDQYEIQKVSIRFSLLKHTHTQLSPFLFLKSSWRTSAAQQVCVKMYQAFDSFWTVSTEGKMQGENQMVWRIRHQMVWRSLQTRQTSVHVSVRQTEQKRL